MLKAEIGEKREKKKKTPPKHQFPKQTRYSIPAFVRKKREKIEKIQNDPLFSLRYP